MEPKAIRFKDDAPEPQSQEPRALRFEDARAVAAPSQGREPAAVKFASSEPDNATTPTPALAPKPLFFSQPDSRAQDDARPAFGASEHPLQRAAVQQAEALNQAGYLAQTEQVERLISRLLQLDVAGLEQWSDTALAAGRETALEMAQVNRRFVALNAAAAIEEVTFAVSPAPPKSLRERIRRGMLLTKLPQQQARLTIARTTLSQLNADMRDLQPKSQKSLARLSASHLACWAVRDVSSAHGDSAKVRQLALQQELLAQAVTQAHMADTLLTQTLRLSEQLYVQTQQLLNVVLSTVALSQSAK